MEKLRPARRTVLRALILAAAAFPLRRFLTPKGEGRGPVVRTPREEIPPDGALVFREARVAVLRAGDEIYALSLSCTHLGCTVAVTPEGLVCPCHGSAFDRTGAVVRGPATRPLDRLAVREEGGAVTVLG